MVSRWETRSQCIFPDLARFWELLDWFLGIVQTEHIWVAAVVLADKVPVLEDKKHLWAGAEVARSGQMNTWLNIEY